MILHFATSQNAHKRFSNSWNRQYVGIRERKSFADHDEMRMYKFAFPDL